MHLPAAFLVFNGLSGLLAGQVVLISLSFSCAGLPLLLY